MGVPDHEVEPVDESENWCDLHACYYRVGLVCGGCLELEFDRAFQDKLDERGQHGL